MNSLLIRNATILTPGGIQTHRSLLLQNGRIAAMGEATDAPADAEIFDADGLIVTPGWIDIQLNGAYGLDFTEQPDTIWQAAEKLPQLGTTSFLPTIITSPLETVEYAIEVQKNKKPANFKGANALGLHLEGPFLNVGKKGAHNPKYLQAPKPELVSNWTRENGVYLVTLAPELDADFATIHRLREQGVVVSIGHSLATYEQAMEAFNAGIQCVTHLFNAQPSIEHRKPGLSVATLTAPEIYHGIIIDGIHMHPGMVSVAYKCKGPQRFITVTDAISALGMPPGKYNLGDFDINVTENTVTLADGTLAGSNVTQQTSLRNLMAWTGCSLYDAIRTLTATPAELFNLPTKGKIAVGMDADLVIITPEIDIKATIVDGEVLYKV